MRLPVSDLVRLVALASLGLTPVAGALAQQPAAPPQQGQQGQQRPPPQQAQGQQQRRPAQQPAQAQPQSVTRIPPPGPAEVPLFPARDYTDPRSNLSFTVPAGWLVIEIPDVPENEIGRIFMEGPGIPSPSCSVVIVRPQQPARVTQAQLNRVIHADQSVASVRNQLGQEGRRVQTVRKLTQNGIAGLSIQVLIPGNQHAPDTTTFVSFFEQVGRRYSINCNAMTLDLTTMQPDIESILRSLRFPTS